MAGVRAVGSPIRSSRALLLSLTHRGFLVPGVGDLPTLRLEPADLTLIGQLLASEPVDPARLVADVVSTTGAEADALWATLEALVERRRVLDATQSSPASVPEPVGAPRMAAVPDVDLVLLTPVTVEPTPSGFRICDPGGGVALEVDAPALLALSAFRHPATVAAAYEAHAEECGLLAVDEDAFTDLIATAVAAGLIEPFDAENAAHIGAHGMAERVRRVEFARARQFLNVASDRADDRALARSADPAKAAKVPVLTVHHPLHYPNLALGMLLAYAKVHDGGRLDAIYDLDPYWDLTRVSIKRILSERGPAVVLFSNYVWSTEENIALSAFVKKVSPDSICIHGGPNTPKYEADTQSYFAANPHVDVTVHGEGEITLAEVLEALDGHIGGRDGDLEVLADVPGLSYRRGTTAIRTGDRGRITDLDILPSPYITGLFDDYAKSTAPLVILETNRGCPYGCTFCDWGSATTSRLRKFGLERIRGELEWAAMHQMPRVFVADSNFGIMSRDVEIAQMMADLKSQYGFPTEFNSSYAKNTVKRIQQIVKILVDAEIICEGTLALQTADEATLSAINRSNIRTDKFIELGAAFREAKLPLFTDLIVGLPGATPQAFWEDLQMSIDYEVSARIFRTEVLVNSPMNEPAYKAEHKVETEAGEVNELIGVVGRRRKSLILSTSTYTADDLRQMMRMRDVYGLVENYGLLRHVARFVRHETGMREVDFYLLLERVVAADPEGYPLITWVLDTLVECATIPLSWRRFYDEVGRFAVEQAGVTPSSALDTVLDVQVALSIDRHRTFPHAVDLTHDYAAWYQGMMAAKDGGRDWIADIPRLETYGPGNLVVDDPTDVCRRAIGANIDWTFHGSWELASAVSRAMPPQWATA